MSKKLSVPKNILKIPNPMDGEKPDYDIYILNQKYGVYEVDMSDTKYDGICFCYPVRKILLDSQNGDFEHLDTFLHEMFHAILYEFGIKNHPEKMISYLAAGLAFQLIDKRNKTKLNQLIRAAEKKFNSGVILKKKIAAKRKKVK